MPKRFPAKSHLTVDLAAVGVEQQLGRFVAHAAGGIVRSADPETVGPPGSHARHKTVPNVAVGFGNSCVSAPSASNRHRVTSSPPDKTAKLVPSALDVAPSGSRGRAGFSGSSGLLTFHEPLDDLRYRGVGPVTAADYVGHQPGPPGLMGCA